MYVNHGLVYGDLDNVTEQGFYYVNQNATDNKPFGVYTYAVMLVVSLPVTDVVAQVTFNNNGKRASRVRNNGTWSTWVEF